MLVNCHFGFDQCFITLSVKNDQLLFKYSTFPFACCQTLDLSYLYHLLLYIFCFFNFIFKLLDSLITEINKTQSTSNHRINCLIFEFISSSNYFLLWKDCCWCYRASRLKSLIFWACVLPMSISQLRSKPIK
jgi:hypothetical protein